MSPAKQMLLNYLNSQPVVTLVSNDLYALNGFLTTGIPELMTNSLVWDGIVTGSGLSLSEQRAGIQKLLAQGKETGQCVLILGTPTPFYLSYGEFVVQVDKIDLQQALFGLSAPAVEVSVVKSKGETPIAEETLVIKC